MTNGLMRNGLTCPSVSLLTARRMRRARTALGLKVCSPATGTGAMGEKVLPILHLLASSELASQGCRAGEAPHPGLVVPRPCDAAATPVRPDCNGEWIYRRGNSMMWVTGRLLFPTLPPVLDGSMLP